MTLVFRWAEINPTLLNVRSILSSFWSRIYSKSSPVSLSLLSSSEPESSSNKEPALSLSLLSSSESGSESSPDGGPKFSVSSSVSSRRVKGTVLVTGSYPSAEARNVAVNFPEGAELESAASSRV